MSDWREFGQETEAEKTRSGPGCGVYVLLQEDVPEDDREYVRSVIDDPKVQSSALRRALVKHIGDKTPSAYAIARHRRGDCSCKREG